MAADLIFDGNTKVAWVPTIASVSAPTALELTGAGTVPLDTRITPDGLNITPSTAEVDNSALSSTFDTTQAGRRSFKIELTLKRLAPPTTDTAFDTLIYQAEGFLVIRRDKAASTAFAAGDSVEVYPVQCGEPQYPQSAPNAIVKYTVPMMCTADPATASNLAVVV